MRLPTFTSLSEGLRATIVRFPLPSLFAAIVTGLLIYMFDSGLDEEVVVRYVLLAGLGFVASLLSDLITESRGSSQRNRLLAQIGVVVLLFLYNSFIMPETLKDPRPPFFYSYFILLFALHLGIALVPAIAPDGSKLLWRFNLNCFLRYFFSSVNAALLFCGLALALLSVDKLFELGLDEDLYPKLWFVCAFFAHPMLFLGGLPRLSQLTDECTFPKPLRFTLCFIGLPLVALYLFILYAYVAKIGIQWSWPNGWVAMPIFVLAVISLLTYVLSLPLPKTENWARLYHSWLYRLLLPLSIVLFLALQVRLGDYGMTINRYLGLALAVWLFGISFAYIIRPGLKIGWMPFSLLLVSLFSIYAGPLGAFGWSERAQVKRLHSMATKMSIMENGTFTPAKSAQQTEVVEAFQSALRYVLEHFGSEALESELAGFSASSLNGDGNTRNNYNMTTRVMEYLELNDDLKKARLNFYANQTVASTYGHAWMIDYNFYNYRRNDSTRNYTLGDDKVEIIADTESHTLTVKANAETIVEMDMIAWAKDVRESIKNQGNSNHDEPLVWHTGQDGWRFSFACTNATLDPKTDAFRSLHLRVFLSPPE